MFGRRESKTEKDSSETQSGKRYKVDTRKIYRGQDLKTFVETDYSPILSKFESERYDNPQITFSYSPFQPKSSPKPESSNSEGLGSFNNPPIPPTPIPLPLRLPLSPQEEVRLMILSYLFL